MHVAIPLYPRFTALDAVGPYTVLAFAPGWRVTFVAPEAGPVLDDQGTLSITATASYADLPTPDVIIVPGGPGTMEALSDEPLLSWLRTAHEHSRWTTSVCSGSLILGAAGLLEGGRATSHWGIIDALRTYGCEPVRERVVTTGKVITAAGVSAGIDMALAFLAEATDEETAKTVQLAIEYDPQPPFAMDPSLAEKAMALIV
ncbi:DJ-1/PfpI family protein [Nonomuraea sp. NBC_01738]|uniref:DJ-1/PfpI family protein n=1 Tax=Nonomuraea sp. NBC_01738 TaxID=2976003 RepID=UPI002E12FAF4|nr:DJ-1/PfpI family protein [Nonomuraea sp. NBC_01738]